VTSPTASIATRQPPRWVLPALWLTLTIALAIVVQGLPWRETLEQLRRVHPAWVITAVVANVVILMIWAAEWRILAPVNVRITYARMFEVVSTMAAVLNSIPFFAGEASGVAMLIGRGGLSRGASLSVLAVDQLLSGLVKLVVLAVAALLIPLPDWLRAGILTLVIGVVLMLAAFVPLAHRWGPMRERLLMRETKARKGAALLVSWGEHLGILRESHRAARVALLALMKKSIELSAILAIQLAFGLSPSLPAAVLALAAVAIATMMPVAPANLGVYEAMVFAAYRYVGVPEETALGLAVVQHACFLIPMLATGYFTLTLRQVLARRAT
jgi:uncharacterized protein (TIRG00374 family)